VPIRAAVNLMFAPILQSHGYEQLTTEEFTPHRRRLGNPRIAPLLENRQKGRTPVISITVEEQNQRYAFAVNWPGCQSEVIHGPAVQI